MRPVPRPTVRALLAGGLLAAGLAVAGCGADVSIGADPSGTGTAPTGSAAASSPVATTTAPPSATGVPGGALTSPPAAGSGNAGELPAGFPLPPGTTVGPVALAGNEIAATLTIPDGKSGYDFWRVQLPTAGYPVAKAEMVGGIGEITFSGNGCWAGSQLGISGQTVAFACKRA
jgi:hypothetical protein